MTKFDNKIRLKNMKHLFVFLSSVDLQPCSICSLLFILLSYVNKKQTKKKKRIKLLFHYG